MEGSQLPSAMATPTTIISQILNWWLFKHLCCVTLPTSTHHRTFDFILSLLSYALSLPCVIENFHFRFRFTWSIAIVIYVGICLYVCACVCLCWLTDWLTDCHHIISSYHPGLFFQLFCSLNIFLLALYVNESNNNKNFLLHIYVCACGIRVKIFIQHFPSYYLNLFPFLFMQFSKIFILAILLVSLSFWRFVCGKGVWKLILKNWFSNIILHCTLFCG